MLITSAEYTISSARVDQCPQGDLPEFAFIGRSNVGKSSLINMLTGRAGLAKTSSTPGKTVLINHFLINSPLSASPSGENSKRRGFDGQGTPPKGERGGGWYLVDLPGYGYAKRGQQQRDELQRMITGYILRREQMLNLFLLIDVRHEPQRIDMEFIEWLGENGIPFSIVFTKADKLSKGKLAANVKHYLAELSKQWEELPPHFVTSSETRQGKEELLAYIEDIILGQV
ncbi:MAG: YihA family ribosome biogenesis GTP-binding protein [Bacteroidaceae bacterium]|nr:YihA family ribosome biogenesis GTP-binding protein [Bacteroidaceae bacterium]MBQ8454063.1 YihA family ribosome biogenesis GTP-binding protein [Bacteroidaceae bacterium]MBQ9295410.1 YihA family ribosome biogenesis GTP-binding protein [Bacteroidaceae bacterium]